MLKLRDEDNNAMLLTHLKSFLVDLLQKGYTRMVTELVRSYIDKCKSYEDCYFILVLDELQAALKSLLSLYRLIRVRFLVLSSLDYKRGVAPIPGSLRYCSAISEVCVDL